MTFFVFYDQPTREWRYEKIKKDYKDYRAP
jgi:hypothetical protein